MRLPLLTIRYTINLAPQVERVTYTLGGMSVYTLGPIALGPLIMHAYQRDMRQSLPVQYGVAPARTPPADSLGEESCIGTLRGLVWRMRRCLACGTET